MKLRRWFVRVVLITVVLVAVTFIANAWFLSSQFLHQNAKNDCEQAKDIFVFCDVISDFDFVDSAVLDFKDMGRRYIEGVIIGFFR